MNNRKDKHKKLREASALWRRCRARQQRGIALFYLSTLLFVLLAFCGLAVDLGRGYIVKAHLSKAVDGAALAAARYIGDGQSVARAEGNKIFGVNFPNGFLGVSSVQNPPNMNFSTGADGSNVITVDSAAVVPTTFMNIAGFRNMTVSSNSQATRRLVDISFVIDKSGSIGSAWPQVQSAATQFVSYFDQSQDRLALIMYSSDTIVYDPISIPRGFSKSSLTSHISSGSSAGFTVMSEGLYRGWDQLRRVPSGTQSGLRVIILFTDGVPNSWSGNFTVSPGYAPQGVVHTLDFPEMGGTSALDDGVNDPCIYALSVTLGTLGGPANQSAWSGGLRQSTRSSNLDLVWNSGTPRVLSLPSQSFHPTPSSTGIPTQFNLFDAALVGGNRPVGTTVKVRNVNNAARNLVEIIANAARTDNSGSYPIRIFTLGMGQQLKLPSGSASETGEDILKRIANDPSSPDFRSGQPEGKYYFAGDASKLNAAFQQIRNQILRLSQ